MQGKDPAEKILVYSSAYLQFWRISCRCFGRKRGYLRFFCKFDLPFEKTVVYSITRNV